jgi:hypothetical protein
MRRGALARQRELGRARTREVRPRLRVAGGRLGVDRVVRHAHVFDAVHAEVVSRDHALLHVVERAHARGADGVPPGEHAGANGTIELERKRE